AAHVTCGARRDEHIARRQLARSRREIQQTSLRGEHQSVFGFGVNLHLRMVGPQMALTASARKPGELHRRSMTRVTSRAIPNGSILVRLSHTVTTRATAFRCRCALKCRQCICRPLYAARLKLFVEGYLLCREILVARNCCLGCGCVPAMKKLLIN